MPEEIAFDKDRFDSVLKRMIDRKPMTFRDAVAKTKLKKDGTPKRGKTVQKMD